MVGARKAFLSLSFPKHRKPSRSGLESGYPMRPRPMPKGPFTSERFKSVGWAVLPASRPTGRLILSRFVLARFTAEPRASASGPLRNSPDLTTPKPAHHSAPPNQVRIEHLSVSHPKLTHISCRNHASPICARSNSSRSLEMREHSVAGTLNRAHASPPNSQSSVS